MPAELPTKRSFDYALSYFDLHAKQRMTVFNFFLVIAGILTGGIAASLGKESSMPTLSVALSIVLILIAIVFWKLDARTSFLIKHAETALKTCEAALLDESAHLISTEEQAFQQFKRDRGFWRSGWTYSVCLRIVFIAMVSIGVIGLALSAARLLQSSSARTPIRECIWLTKTDHGSTISVGQSNQCSSRSWVAFVTST